MLSRIFIKNYILIDEIELDFAEGLNIITGETGSGKSIMINAIDIAFGAKVGKEVIKTGADKAVIELTIVNKTHNLTEKFDEYGIDNNGEEIVLSREITQTGSRARINGCLVNQECLKFMREKFLDIHSQYQTYAFLQPKFHISLLDAYIKDPLLNEYKTEYEQYQNKLSELEELKKASQKTEEQIDFLRFQVDEIESAKITSITEDEELSNELAVLENSEKLKELTGSSYWSLSGDDGSIVEALFDIKSSLAKASSIDVTLEDSEVELIEIIENLKCLSSKLRDYSSSMECDTARIDVIQERLFIFDKLKHKYGGSLEKIVQTGERLCKELDEVECSTKNIDELQKEIYTRAQQLTEKAQKISQVRQEQGVILSQKIIEKLEKLELPKVKFEIGFTKTDLTSNGIDKVEFLISTNISEGLKPLAKVASGGEISRVMLAIKSIFAETDNINTVIFDEIDTGISGKTSQSVADEVKELSKYMQILMITHQAIIASKSDRHFYVKKTQSDKTSVEISILEGENKLKGIAELASGEINEESMQFARTLVGV